MTVAELMDALFDLPGETPVHVIFNGTIDESPAYNVEDASYDRPVLYIEGAG